MSYNWNVIVSDGIIDVWSNDTYKFEISYPSKFQIFQNYPNPFSWTTEIEYELPKSCLVQLKIFNLLGQEVKTLVDKFQEIGSKSVIWDGRDNHGMKIRSGIYFYKFEAMDFVQKKRIIFFH
jgi:hypothetical protein